MSRHDLPDLVRGLADGLLFPEALATEQASCVPARLLDALADAGLYGLVGPREVGGWGADEIARMMATEILASGCLTTTFVWAQHHNAVSTIASSPSAELRDRWLVPLCSGSTRAGVAFAGLRRDGPPVLGVRRHGSTWRLDGSAPWVSGWGTVDVVHVAARDRAGRVVWALLDAVAGPSLRAKPISLSAVRASATVELHFNGHPVPEDRITLIEDHRDWVRRDEAGLRGNGALSLGVARRCAQLLGHPRWTAVLDRARDRLLAAAPAEVASSRAATSWLALELATANVVGGGGRSVKIGTHAARLFREAMFLQVLGQTSPIRAAQLALLAEGVGATPRIDREE